MVSADVGVGLPVALPKPPTGEGGDKGRGAWQVLGEIMDPEVPVISIVELGIVRDVREVADACALQARGRSW